MDHFQASTDVFSPARKGQSGALSSEHRAVFGLTFRLAYRQPYEALGFLGEEYGEVAKKITKEKPGWNERTNDELLDLIIVAVRMLLREYEHVDV